MRTRRVRYRRKALCSAKTLGRSANLKILEATLLAGFFIIRSLNSRHNRDSARTLCNDTFARDKRRLVWKSIAVSRIIRNFAEQNRLAPHFHGRRPRRPRHEKKSSPPGPIAQLVRAPDS